MLVVSKLCTPKWHRTRSRSLSGLVDAVFRPLVARDSQDTCASASLDKISSRIASEKASQALSGCPSVTDSDVNKNLFKLFSS